MMSRITLVRLLPLCLLFWVALSATAFAQTTHDRTQFGHDINIEPGEQVGDATCFGCSIRVRGHVATDVTAFGGSVVVEDQGQVEGDAVVFGGSVRLENNVKVGGDITVFGGQVRRNPATSVGGDVTNFSGSIWIFLIFVLPLVILAAFITLIVWVIRRLIRPAAPVPA